VTACAIVQARMGSGRFPGKMLREIAGKPLIWHVIHRLQQCGNIAEIILATSDQPTDDPLAAYVALLGVAVVRGPEKNVLQRYATALKATKADIIIRITGDAALIDPSLIDRLIDCLRQSGKDYVLCSEPASDCGIDPVTRSTLQRLIEERADHPAAIEHVTGYLQVEPSFAHRATLSIAGENRFVAGARLSVDTPADLAFMDAVYRRLGATAGDAKFLDVLALLRHEPELLAINGHVRQRGASEEPPSILIRCDGGHRIGLGHVVRCLAIAGALRDRYAAAVSFALGGDKAAFDLVSAQAFPIHAMRDTEPEQELAEALTVASPDVVLMDVRTPFNAAEIAAIRRAARGLVVLDDPGPRRLRADLIFCPPSGATLDWSGAVGERCVGFEWIPLRAQFSPPPARHLSKPPLALILGGGADPAGIGRRFLARAMHALPVDWRIGMVIGSAAARDPELEALACGLGSRLTLYRHLKDIADVMAQADLALAAFGMTAYELAAVGVPSLLLCLTEDHRRSALALSDAGAARVLGVAEETTDQSIGREIAILCADAGLREKMSLRATRLIDGAGAARIANRIAALAQQAEYTATKAS
jgi:spore coat polysaccharide biosynthesis protein SpsF